MIPKYHYHEPVTFKEKFAVSDSKVGAPDIFIPAFTKGEAILYDKHGTEDKVDDDLVEIKIGKCEEKPELEEKTVWVKYDDFKKLRDY